MTCAWLFWPIYIHTLLLTSLLLSSIPPSILLIPSPPLIVNCHTQPQYSHGDRFIDCWIWQTKSLPPYITNAHSHCTVTSALVLLLVLSPVDRVVTQVYTPLWFLRIPGSVYTVSVLTSCPAGLNQFGMGRGRELVVSQLNSSVPPSLTVVFPVISGRRKTTEKWCEHHNTKHSCTQYDLLIRNTNTLWVPWALLHCISTVVIVLNTVSESYTTRTPFTTLPSVVSTSKLLIRYVAFVATIPLNTHCTQSVPGGALRMTSLIVKFKVALQSSGPSWGCECTGIGWRRRKLENSTCRDTVQQTSCLIQE